CSRPETGTFIATIVAITEARVISGWGRIGPGSGGGHGPAPVPWSHRSRPAGRPDSILGRFGRAGLGGAPPAVAIRTIVRVGMTHPVYDRPEDGDPGPVELAAGPLHLGEPADVVAHRQHGAVDPSADDQRIGDRQDRGRIDDDQVVELAELPDQDPQL